MLMSFDITKRANLASNLQNNAKVNSKSIQKIHTKVYDLRIKYRFLKYESGLQNECDSNARS